MLSIHLRLGLPSGLFPSGFPTQITNTVKNKKEAVGLERGPLSPCEDK
jgi:hypothetical protein